MVAGCTQIPRTTVFTPPDGHWWIAASAEARDGFDIGYDECAGTRLSWHGPAMSRPAFEEAVTKYYHTHPEGIGIPVATVLARLEAPWRTSRVRPCPAGNDYNGDMWWPAATANQDGIIRGYLACQAAEHGLRIAVPVPVLIERVSKWYGVDPNQEGIVNPTTIHDSLSAVILHAEKQGP